MPQARVVGHVILRVAYRLRTLVVVPASHAGRLRWHHSGPVIRRTARSPAARQPRPASSATRSTAAPASPSTRSAAAAARATSRSDATFASALRALAKRQADEDEGLYRAVENLRFDLGGPLARAARAAEAEHGRRLQAHDRLRQGGVRQEARPEGHAGRHRRPAQDAAREEAVPVDAGAAPPRARRLLPLRGPARARGAEPDRPAAGSGAAAVGNARVGLLRRRRAAAAPRQELPDGLWARLVRVARVTGMREGEFSALTWGDVDLTAGTIRVRRTYSAGRVGQTKGRSRVRLTYRPKPLSCSAAGGANPGSPRRRALFPGRTVVAFNRSGGTRRPVRGDE